MGLCNIYRLVIQGFIVLLFINVVQLSTITKYVNLTSEVQAEANHLRSLGRIVNGTAATLGQFPHQVSLRYSTTGSHFCGGSIIDSEWILTAAHCMHHAYTGVQLQIWELGVAAGGLWLNQTSTTSQIRSVIEIIIHINYNAATYENDIALLRLVFPLVLDNYTVAYPQLQRSQVSVGTVCQVAGWGYPASNIPSVMNELMYVDVPILSQQLCRELYIEFSDVPEGMICAGYIEGLRDACQGDSGGGLICNGVLTGIVSWGEECALPNYPGVYTEVRYYHGWISDYLGWDLEDDNGVDGVKSSLWTTLLSLLVIRFITST